MSTGQSVLANGDPLWVYIKTDWDRTFVSNLKFLDWLRLQLQAVPLDPQTPGSDPLLDYVRQRLTAAKLVQSTELQTGTQSAQPVQQAPLQPGVVHNQRQTNGASITQPPVSAPSSNPTVQVTYSEPTRLDPIASRTSNASSKNQLANQTHPVSSQAPFSSFPNATGVQGQSLHPANAPLQNQRFLMVDGPSGGEESSDGEGMFGVDSFTADPFGNRVAQPSTSLPNPYTSMYSSSAYNNVDMYTARSQPATYSSQLGAMSDAHLPSSTPSAANYDLLLGQSNGFPTSNRISVPQEVTMDGFMIDPALTHNGASASWTAQAPNQVVGSAHQGSAQLSKTLPITARSRSATPLAMSATPTSPYDTEIWEEKIGLIRNVLASIIKAPTRAGIKLPELLHIFRTPKPQPSGDWSSIPLDGRVMVLKSIVDRKAKAEFYSAWVGERKGMEVLEAWFKGVAYGFEKGKGKESEGGLMEILLGLLLEMLRHLPVTVEELKNYAFAKYMLRINNEKLRGIYSENARSAAKAIETKWRELLNSEGARNGNVTKPKAPPKPILPVKSETRTEVRVVIPKSEAKRPAELPSDAGAKKRKVEVIKASAGPKVTTDSLFSQDRKLPTIKKAKKPLASPATAAALVKSDAFAEAMAALRGKGDSVTTALEDRLANRTPGVSAKTGKPKKKVTWPAEDKLENIRMIEAREGPDRSATSGLGSMKSMEHGEGQALHRPTESLMEEEIEWEDAVPWQLPESVQAAYEALVIQSAEAHVQEEREKRALATVYMATDDIPESADEPAETDSIAVDEVPRIMKLPAILRDDPEVPKLIALAQAGNTGASAQLADDSSVSSLLAQLSAPELTRLMGSNSSASCESNTFSPLSGCVFSEASSMTVPTGMPPLAAPQPHLAGIDLSLLSQLPASFGTSQPPGLSDVNMIPVGGGVQRKENGDAGAGDGGKAVYNAWDNGEPWKSERKRVKSKSGGNPNARKPGYDRSGNRIVCKNWLADGQCRHGTGCYYKHG